MLKIISHTPIYVWPFLVYLLWGGWKSRKMYVVPWRPLLILPAIMFIWSIYSIAIRYGCVAICFWGVSITIGIWLGMVTMRGLQLRFDKKRDLIEIAGNWTPLILSISIFALRYTLNAVYGLDLELTDNASLLALENVTTIVSGMFTGRLIGYWRRSKISPHVDLAEVKA